MSESDPVAMAKMNQDEYPERIKYIVAALKACRQSDTPVGLRLDRIMSLYNHFYGKDHFSEIPITNEAEVLALIIDHVKLDRKALKKRAPLLSFYYESFRKSRLDVDTKSLYDFLKPEIKTHLRRYSILDA